MMRIHGCLPFLLLLAFPVLEIAIFIAVGNQIGLIATLGLILATTAFGILLLRGQINRLRQVFQGSTSIKMLRSSDAWLAVSALLLIVPGFITDALALILLVPGLRTLIRSAPGQSAGVREDEGGIVVDLEEGEFESHEKRPDSKWAVHNKNQSRDDN